MTGPIAFVINRRAGGGANAQWLDAERERIEALAAGGPISWLEAGDEVESIVDRALGQGCRTVVAGGGDGTLSAVAGRLVGRDASFGVLPLGTLNHFAKDAGIPLDLSQALQAIGDGCTRQLDIAAVNDSWFLNNSSIGLYVDLVRDRELQQSLLGRGKWPAFALALIGALRRYPFVEVVLTVDGVSSRHRTPFVFVGNNAYCTEGLQIGRREALDGGRLTVHMADRSGRLRLLALALRALTGRLAEAKDFRSIAATELRIETGRHHLRVAADGEVCRLATPLHYRIHPGALRVIVPAEPAGDDARPDAETRAAG